MEADGGVHVRNEDVPPQNQDISFILPSVSVFLSDYGWYLLFLCVGVYLLIQHLRKNRSWENQSPSVTANQDPVSVARRQEALQASRQRMQEELDARAAEFKEKQLRLEEGKRRQKIEIWESMKEGKTCKGNAKSEHNTEEATSTFLKPKTDKKSLRNSGYNPLSGDGGGTCSWRPGRRGPFAGG
ncbi:selenoprotein S [Xyrauchen texanus]|uniref:selenoprotein S n=1 Tax=Xyrauchen texanus TaxID=154827 RepID=UPI0022427556|nr:selenoprotein S [Xyrauchen texanus]